MNETEDTLVQILQAFLESGMKGVKLDGISDIIQDVARKHDLPVEVLERRNVIYLRRTDIDAS